MGGACARFLAGGIARSRSLLPMEKYICSEQCGGLHFFKGNFQVFCLGNQVDISCISPGFVVSPRKQQLLPFFVDFIFQRKAFLPTFSMSFVAPSSFERTISSKAPCPAASADPGQRPEKLICRFFCYRLGFRFPCKLVRKLN